MQTKQKLQTLFGSLKKKADPKILFFFFLVLLSGFLSWRTYSVFYFKATVPARDSGSLSEDQALPALAEAMNIDESQLVTVGLPPVTNAIFANAQTKTLYVQMSPGSPVTAIGYLGGDGPLISPKPSSQESFDSLIATSFQIPGYTDLLTQKKLPDSTTLYGFAPAGVNHDQVRQILAAGKGDLRAILLSLMYNSLTEAGEGYIATVIDNRRLKLLTKKNWLIDRIDGYRLSMSLDKIKNEAGSKQKEPIDTEKEAVSVQRSLNTLFGKKTIQLNTTLPFPFVFVNPKTNTLYCGERSCVFKPSTLLPVSNGDAASVLKHVSFGGDTGTIATGAGMVPELFKKLLSHVIDHPGIYFVNDGELQPYESAKADSRYGRFDTAVLRTGLGTLESAGQKGPEMTLMPKAHEIPILLYATLFLLLCNTGFLLFFRRGPKETTIAAGFTDMLVVSETTPAFPDPIVPDPIIPDKTVEAPVEPVLPRPTPLRPIQIEPPPDTLKKFFQKVDKIESARGKTRLLLSEYDEYLGSGKKLTENYSNLRKIAETYDRLGNLLVEKNPGDFYSYLEKQIQTIALDPNLGTLVTFVQLFQAPGRKKIVFDNEVGEQKQLIAGADRLYARYKKLSGLKPDLINRSAFLCWSVQLANEVIRIREAKFEGLDIKKIEQDQLQLIVAKYFLNVAAAPEKTGKDFEVLLTDGATRIGEINTALGGDIPQLSLTEVQPAIDTMKGLLEKIKAHDKTGLYFQKMHTHFVDALNNKIEKLEYTRTELIPADQSWLLQAVFNIAFHAADFTEQFVNKRTDYYHANVRLLLNDLDRSKVETRQFIEGNIDHSTRASNAVVKAARFAKIKRLDFLVNHYYISPEQIG